MKKIFTLIAVAAMALTVNAQTTVFSATPLTTLGANWDTPTGETEITATYAEIAGGKMYTINQQDAEKQMIKKQGNEYAFQCTNNNTFFKVVLDEALQAGDVISARMQSRTDTDLGLFFDKSDSRPSETTTSIILASADAQAWVDTPTYKVAADDAICGEKTFQSTYFNTFKITRSSTTGIQGVQAEKADAAAYNLAGQKVSENYKGVVIKNGKKVVK